MPNPSDRLLRTFASVPVTSRVLDLGCGHGRHTAPLTALGFDVYACDVDEGAVSATRAVAASGMGENRAGERVSHVPRLAALGYPDAFFDWVVAYDLADAVDSREEMVEVLREIRRVLTPGGWVYLAVPAIPANFNPVTDAADYASDSGPAFSFTEETLNALAGEAGLDLAERPDVHTTDRPRLEAVYRRVESDTIR